MGFGRRTPQNFLNSIWQDYELSQIERVLDPLGKAISACGERIDQVAADEVEYLDSVIDEDVYLIEDLLGTAFVVCQTDITYTVSRVTTLHRFCETSKGTTLTTTNSKRDQLLALDQQILSGANLTQIQAIDVFANYFKHKDEWSKSWNDIATSTGNSVAKKTVQSILSVGAEEYSNGNFRELAGKLGNTTYDNMGAFITILQTWKRYIRNLYEVELRQKGLL